MLAVGFVIVNGLSFSFGPLLCCTTTSSSEDGRAPRRPPETDLSDRCPSEVLTVVDLMGRDPLNKENGLSYIILFNLE